MTRFVALRVAQFVPLVLAVLSINFLVVHLAPGDPAVIIAGADAPPEYILQVRKAYGFDKPLYEQYAIYLRTIVAGDFGTSFGYNAPVLDVIASSVPATLILMSVAMVISLVFGVAAGIIAAARRGTAIDYGLSLASVVGYSVPEFWAGILAILIFGVWLRWLPANGYGGIDLHGIARLLDVGRHLVLPAMVLGLTQAALYARLTRAGALEVLDSDFTRTARSKGVSNTGVLARHVLPNVLLPVVTLVGLRLRLLFMGALLTETVFGWPGVGLLTYRSLGRRDFYLLLAIFLIVGVLSFIGNFLADIMYGVVDPRVRYG